MCTFIPDGYYAGLSTDEKPTKSVRNGAIFVEMDTATIYFYDKDGGAWLPFEG